MFNPNVNDLILIGNNEWRVTPHPDVPGGDMPYGQTGRAATVYQLRDPRGELAALKVFSPSHRRPSLAEQATLLNHYAALPGLRACHRAVLVPKWQRDLLAQHPDLQYAALMLWVKGRSWFSIILEAQPLSKEQCHALAAALLAVLAQLAREGLAHGDLSGANLMIDGLDTGDVRVELVDVEQLYSPALLRPDNIPAGTPGYAHATVAGRLWQANMDRFAGAILLAEILGWCDERVRAAAAGDSYFEQDELQTDCERYRLLRDVLAEQWGGGAAALLEQAWRSETLADCPAFDAGQLGLPPLPEPPPRPPVRDTVRDGWLAVAAAAEQAQQWGRAADAYERLIIDWPRDAEVGRWTAALANARAEERLALGAGDEPTPSRSGRGVVMLVALFLLFLIGGGAALALNWPSGGEGQPGPTAQDDELPETSPVDTSAIPTEPSSMATPLSGVDSDSDGVTDEEELQIYNTDPNNSDTDGDGLSDGQEVHNYNTDPNNPDTDGDGLSDGQEVHNYNTDPNNPDTDGDGLSDGQEVQNYNTDPHNPDTDGDGLTDGQEVHNYNTDPNNPDTDGDGLSDGQEVQNYNTDPHNPDTDGDGLTDWEEVFEHRTDPLRRDSDNDGVDDGAGSGDSKTSEETDRADSAVASLELVNPATGRRQQIENDDAISLRQMGCGTRGVCNLNVEAIVDDSAVRSVTFKLDGRDFWSNGRFLENTAPYYMAGDTGNGPNRNWDWATLIGGTRTIEAIPCDRSNGEGNCGPSYLVSFTVTR